MFYPKHHLRSYCRYLGSLEINGKKLDMGVYEAPNNTVSHAIVFGNEDWEYYSGDIDLTHPERNLQSTPFSINRLLYLEGK
jgi:hypothetical protein